MEELKSESKEKNDNIFDLWTLEIKKDENTSKVREFSLLLPNLFIGILFWILFNIFFIGEKIGISYFLFMSLLLILTSFYTIKKNLKYSLYDKIIIFFILWLSLYVGILYNWFVTFLNITFSFLAYLFLIRNISNKDKNIIGTFDIIKTPFELLDKWTETYKEASKSINKESLKKYTNIFKSLLITLPVLLILWALLYSWDSVFEYFINKTFWNLSFNIDISIIKNIFFILITSIFVSWFISQFELNSFLETKQKKDPSRFFWILEWKMLLWWVSLLFLVYIILQISYLILWDDIIKNSWFTYAEYAKKWYYELWVIAIISYIIILWVYNHIQVLSKYVKYVSLIIILEIFFLIISAILRLNLYENAYGYSIIRFYWYAIFIWLFFIFVGLFIRILKDFNRQFFINYTILTTLFVIMIINFINPDNFIAWENIKRSLILNKSLDRSFLFNSLSRDAVENTIKINQIKNITPEELKYQNERIDILKNYLKNEENTSIYNFHYSTYKAKKLLLKK